MRVRVHMDLIWGRTRARTQISPSNIISFNKPFYLIYLYKLQQPQHAAHRVRPFKKKKKLRQVGSRALHGRW